ncbi:MAG TPA: protein-L-isoaspartate(D-aspartate) O-methyltransferase [Thermoanaerobaculia bacterium]
MSPVDPNLARAACAAAEARKALAARLRAMGLLKDPRLLAAFESVPRHLFIPKSFESEAYGDRALPIGEGQTITQPANVARSVELLDLKPGAKVLEIGTGSGYQTAILAAVCHHVFSLERIPSLAAGALKLLASLGIKNVSVKVFDGSYGWGDHAPYDGIVVAAAATEVPAPLLIQLKGGGRLVIPAGPPERQRLLLIRKLPNGNTRTEDAGEVSFVPLVGRFGYTAALERSRPPGGERK